ncbi:uncharacterized protein LOC121301793 [Polyodon spathula]|uniref:uncharacterized protein LOC121301793 n=1 Tax=Polyodon spathula TaxID=7913 RepID=UPI001B7DC9D0|nr:uncharacterized protein LOC121301793 [Polyodon spathula]
MNSLVLLYLCWVTSGAGGTPRVEFQREVMGFVGQNVTLYCSLVDGGQNIQVVQVSWVRSPEQKLAVFNPSFGTSYPSGDWAGRLSVNNDTARLKETSLTVTACHSQDQGQYNCDFTIFPSGIHRGQIKLTIAELVEIPVLEPVSLSCLESPWRPGPNSSGTVQWFRWSQAGGGWSLVLTVQLESRAVRCSGELSACSTDLNWTPSLSQAGRYRCHWTNGTGHFNRTLLLRASSTGPLSSGLSGHIVTALVLTGLGVSVTLLILVLLYWRMAHRKALLPMEYTINLNQNHEITYTSVQTEGAPPSGRTENDRRESPLYANIVRRSMEQSVYSTVRVREGGGSIQVPPEHHPTDS